MTSLLLPTVPAGAFDAFVDDAARASRAQRSWAPEDGPLPALFVSHGSPLLFDDPQWLRELHAWALTMPRPRAILIVSAHWEAAPLRLSGHGAHLPLVYDFGGLARRYYELAYPTPDASWLAEAARAALGGPAKVHEQPNRGLDHGAWVPLKAMYPLADVPVLQLSIPTGDPGTLLSLGRRLRPLRAEGVLVIGSGFMTHGLPFLSRDVLADDTTPAWSRDFDAWAADALARGDVDALADYRTRAPGMPYAHPSVEHFVPLFITLGAATDPSAPVTTTITGYQTGLSRRSFQVG
ncbi:MAG: dioxygenase [Frankia sp.]|nr:dioxygenase [Frankia sp.]